MIDKETARLSQCVGKQGFKDRRYAVEAAKRRRGREVYRCSHCREYHVGSAPKSTKGNGKGRNDDKR